MPAFSSQRGARVAVGALVGTADGSWVAVKVIVGIGWGMMIGESFRALQPAASAAKKIAIQEFMLRNEKE